MAQAMKRKDWSKWKKAIDAETQQLMDEGVFENI